MTLNLLFWALGWLLVAFFGVQAVIFIALVLWTVWNNAVRPRLIAADEIDRVADDMIATCPDPQAEAFARHERAWYRSDRAGQAYWHRVRRAVQRKMCDRPWHESRGPGVRRRG